MTHEISQNQMKGETGKEKKRRKTNDITLAYQLGIPYLENSNCDQGDKINNMMT